MLGGAHNRRITFWTPWMMRVRQVEYCQEPEYIARCTCYSQQMSSRDAAADIAIEYQVNQFYCLRQGQCILSAVDELAL